MKFCRMCVNKIKNESDGICSECKKALNVINIKDALNFTKDSVLYDDFNNFILSRKNGEILYAYSGGLDSTVVLFLLKSHCKKNNIKLNLFTIDNGFKGIKTWENINRIVDSFNLKDSFKIYDIRKDVLNTSTIIDVFRGNNSVEEFYSLCILFGILPCGKVCNSIMNYYYKIIMEEHNEQYLVTGGDTPKFNGEKYSIFWKKPVGITIVRGGAGLRINKNISKQIIKFNNIPWINPNYGGYDTDCLVPGSVFSMNNDGKKEINYEILKEKYPVVLEYLKERTRLGIIDLKNAKETILNLDISSYQGFVEANKEAVRVLERRINNVI